METIESGPLPPGGLRPPAPALSVTRERETSQQPLLGFKISHEKVERGVRILLRPITRQLFPPGQRVDPRSTSGPEWSREFLSCPMIRTLHTTFYIPYAKT